MIAPAGYIVSALGALEPPEALGPPDMVMYTLVAMAIIAMGMAISLLSHYRRCPSNRVLVIYGKTGKGPAKCVYGGAVFVWPLVQAYDYLDLDAFTVASGLISGPSKDNVPVSMAMKATAAISSEPGLVERAAARLLALTVAKQKELVAGILASRAREVISGALVDRLRQDPRGFRERTARLLSEKLAEIGVVLIDLDVYDLAIRDEQTLAALTPASPNTTPQVRQGN